MNALRLNMAVKYSATATERLDVLACISLLIELALLFGGGLNFAKGGKIRIA
jgi:hypothetical protein